MALGDCCDDKVFFKINKGNCKTNYLPIFGDGIFRSCLRPI